MRMTMLHKVMLVAIAGTLLFTLLAVPEVLCQDKGTNDPGYYNKRGVEFFNKGFYDHAPKNQAAEAELNYRYAIKEFKAAIANDPSYAESHRNLARLYYVQRDFGGAAQEYKKVTQLDPKDLDSYVNLALALIELKEFDEAVGALESAKEQTSDPKILYMFDTYITKVRIQQAKGVR